MPPRNRDGNERRPRQVGTRSPQTEYYLVVTDAAHTEKNYLDGLKKSLPEDARGKIQIKFKKANTSDLIDTCIDEAQRSSQYRNLWIVFDRDEVVEFDKLIDKAEQLDIEVAWSNPCLEIWFHAYFGEMPQSATSQDCIRNFAAAFEKKTGQTYQKNDTDIYRKLAENGDETRAIQIAESKYQNYIRNELAENGDETRAIQIAESKYQNYIRNELASPSRMSPCTTMHHLIKKLNESAGIVRNI